MIRVSLAGLLLRAEAIKTELQSLEKHRKSEKVLDVVVNTGRLITMWGSADSAARLVVSTLDLMGLDSVALKAKLEPKLKALEDFVDTRSIENKPVIMGLLSDLSKKHKEKLL